MIEGLIKRYGSNIIFVHIPQKDEVISGRKNVVGNKVFEKIQNFGGLIFDGHSECGFQKSDYLINDSHPNTEGYEKLSQCVRTAIKLNWEF